VYTVLRLLVLIMLFVVPTTTLVFGQNSPQDGLSENTETDENSQFDTNEPQIIIDDSLESVPEGDGTPAPEIDPLLIKYNYYYDPPSFDGLFHGTSFFGDLPADPGLNFGIGLGFASNTGRNPEAENYQTIRFQLQYVEGIAAITLDAQIKFKVNLTEDPEFAIATEEFAAADTSGLIKTYLPILQVRLNEPDDLSYLKVGSLSDITFGNGLLVQDYTNSLDLINHRTPGIYGRLDGADFMFPYLGGEILFGDIAFTDTLAARIFSKPFLANRNSYFREFLVGASFGMDRGTFSTFDDILFDSLRGGAIRFMVGGDILLPLIAEEDFQMVMYGDYIWGGEDSTMAQLGFQFEFSDQTDIEIFTNFLFFQRRIVPFYFNRNYQQYGLEQTTNVTGLLQEESRIRYKWEAKANLFILDKSMKVGFLTRLPFWFSEEILELVDGMDFGLEFKILEGRLLVLRGITASAHFFKQRLMTFSEFGNLKDTFFGLKFGTRARNIQVELIIEMRPKYEFLQDIIDAGVTPSQTDLINYTEHLESEANYTMYVGLQGVMTF